MDYDVDEKQAQESKFKEDKCAYLQHFNGSWLDAICMTS